MKDKENSKTTGAFKNMLKCFIFSSTLDFWVKVRLPEKKLGKDT